MPESGVGSSTTIFWGPLVLVGVRTEGGTSGLHVFPLRIVIRVGVNLDRVGRKGVVAPGRTQAQHG